MAGVFLPFFLNRRVFNDISYPSASNCQRCEWLHWGPGGVLDCEWADVELVRTRLWNITFPWVIGTYRDSVGYDQTKYNLYLYIPHHYNYIGGDWTRLGKRQSDLIKDMIPH